MLAEIILSTLITAQPVHQEAVERPKRPHMEELIYNVAVGEGVSPEDAERLIEIARCESRLDPLAKNPNSSARGLFQHLAFWADEFNIEPEQFYDPVISTQAAVDVLERQGWNAWVCNDLI